MPNYVAGIGPLHPDLMIIGEAPGRFENQVGMPFVGPSGELLDEFLRPTGVTRHEIYITNVSKYQPPGNDFTKLHLIGVNVDQCVTELWEEIRRCNPKCILAVGRYAMRAVMGWSMEIPKKGSDSHPITDYRGSILKARDGKTKCVPTIHPAALFNRNNNEEDNAGALDYTYSKLIAHDIQRAVEESKSADFRLPDRNLLVCHSSLDLHKFFSNYSHLTKAASDIESINCIPVCTGFAFNRHHAISVPLLTHVGKVQLTDMSRREVVECWRMIDQKYREIDIIGTNFKYDEFKLGLFGFRIKRLISDTLIKTRVLFPELPKKRLVEQASIWTREPYYKDEGKEFKIGKKPPSQLFLYNAKDCAVEFEVDEEQEQDLIGLQEAYNIPLVDYYYNYMMRKHPFYLEMENNGFRVDHTVKLELLEKYTQLQEDAHERLIEKVGYDVNVKSSPDMNHLLYEAMKFYRIKRAPTSEDAIVRLMGNHCKGKDGDFKKRILENILEERRIRDQKSRYINFCPDYDGRCKTSFNISATETCRSSTSILDKPVRPKKIGLAFHTISKHGKLAKSIRSMFIPDEGKVFLQADSSQAEARVVAVLSKDYELLRAFDTIDIHRRTAALILGLSSNLDLSPGNHISDTIGKDSPERFCGKKTRHAGNYDMKKARFMLEFNTDAQKFEINMEISEWRAGKMLELFHGASPNIKQVFHSDIKDAINSGRVLIDPFGGIRVFNGRLDESLYQEAYANIPQRTVAHLVQGAALKINDELGDEVGPVKSNRPVNWISENHDSLLLQVPENGWEKYALLLKKHMTAVIDFSKYCTLKRDYKLTIPCDIEISDTNYAEMRKARLAA